MQDMLVRLMQLPDISPEESQMPNLGIVIRRPIPPEKNIVVDWVRTHFSAYWANEAELAFSARPTHCFIAQKDQEILGFACYECTARNFFGPTGVHPDHQGKGIGKVLLVRSLMALREMGYAYAIIGGVGPADYYQRTVGATIIEGSQTSIYQNLLKQPQ